MKALLILLPLVLLAGCESTRIRGAVIALPPPPLAPVSGTELDPANVENVRISENLKAYPTGRTIDPSDPQVMHEAHVIFRRETAPSWNLQPNAPTVVPLGPTLAVADPAKQPNPLPAELEKKIAEQNQLMRSLIEQNDALGSELGKLGKELVELRNKTAATLSDRK